MKKEKGVKGDFLLPKDSQWASSQGQNIATLYCWMVKLYSDWFLDGCSFVWYYGQIISPLSNENKKCKEYNTILFTEECS